MFGDKMTRPTVLRDSLPPLFHFKEYERDSVDSVDHDGVDNMLYESKWTI